MYFYDMENNNNSKTHKIQFVKDFLGVEVLINDQDLNKSARRLAKEHRMFLLASHSGVMHFVTKSKDDLDSFKAAIAEL
jgi:hypothetical protein